MQRGVLLIGDNAIYQQLADAVGPATRWSRLRDTAFAIDNRPTPLLEQVRAGLLLYTETVKLLGDSIQPADAPVIRNAVALIEAAHLQ